MSDNNPPNNDPGNNPPGQNPPPTGGQPPANNPPAGNDPKPPPKDDVQAQIQAALAEQQKRFAQQLKALTGHERIEDLKAARRGGRHGIGQHAA